MIFAVVSARVAGLDRIKSGCTSRFANRLPIFGAGNGAVRAAAEKSASWAHDVQPPAI
jgi:hypothetical protein